MTAPPLFTGLTKPVHFLGVTMEYTLFVLLLCAGLLVIMENLAMLLLWLPCHALGWLLCQYDAHIFQILVKRWRCPIIKLTHQWGCRSYAPY
jgi:type IV secretion system protein VirB3